MILSEKTEYYCIKYIDNVRYYLVLPSFKFLKCDGYDKFHFPGTSTKEELQNFLDKFVTKDLLQDSKIVNITTTRILNEE